MSGSKRGRQAGADGPEAHDEVLGEFRRRRDEIRTEMGGSERIAAVHERGARTIRERIDAFLDDASFEEIGTFARSAVKRDAPHTPGDGKVGGHGTVAGRPVTVAGDDVTVKRGSSAMTGSRKIDRLFDQAMSGGHPFVYIGETGGARIPDILGAETFTRLPPIPKLASRRRRIPMATAIVGESFGGSSFVAAMSDFVVQVRGSCLAVTSPRVIEVATGEQVSMEELGGVDVSARETGQIDLGVETEDEALEAIRRFLSYLPSNGWTPPPRLPRPDDLVPDPRLLDAVPARASRAYDARRLLRHVFDGGEFLELKPAFGRSIITALGRLGGHSVGVIASQPTHSAGALTPDACDKAARFVCTCDAFGLPLVMLQDTPGFMVGRAVEHQKLLSKAIMFEEALLLSAVPKLTVVLRKAFGLAFFSLGGPDMGTDLVAAWPGAQLGFMDPMVGANVVHGRRLSALEGEARHAELSRLAAEMTEETTPIAAAGVMGVDEVIDPADTRVLLAAHLDRAQGRRFEPGCERPLAAWPTCW